MLQHKCRRAYCVGAAAGRQSPEAKAQHTLLQRLQQNEDVHKAVRQPLGLTGTCLLLQDTMQTRVPGQQL